MQPKVGISGIIISTPGNIVTSTLYVTYLLRRLRNLPWMVNGPIFLVGASVSVGKSVKRILQSPA